MTSILGDDIFFFDESLIVEFKGKRNVVSTCNLNGGYREDLQFVFNNSCGKRLMAGEVVNMEGDSMLDHYKVITQSLNLPIDSTSGMCTAAFIENTAFVTCNYGLVDVTAIVTAGIDVNAGRAGDLARFNEFSREPISVPPGTINIILLVDARLDAGTLTRAILTATEAKTAALQELMANSLYSEDLATGSGTDGIIVIGNLESETYLFDAGKHCILGELIGISVKQGVKKALAKKEDGMNAKRQASVKWQNKRYGISEEGILELYANGVVSDEVKVKLDQLLVEPSIVAHVASIVHLVDQYRWGLLSDEVLKDVGGKLLNLFRARYDLEQKEMENIVVFSYKTIIEEIKNTLAEILAKA